MPNRIEKAASEVMGAMKDVKATFKGLTGVFKHLMEEHGKVGPMLKRVGMSSDAKVRAELYPTLRHELLGHETGELKVVYPALAEYPETSAIAEEHARQAGELQQCIEELDRLSFGDAAWGPTFDRLASMVEEHVSKEEGDYFPKAQKVLGDQRAEELLPRFEAAKKSAPGA
jgi:iron-sulfur cluster repair protein YtfE (RIC family)